jgi:hypothetical protein
VDNPGFDTPLNGVDIGVFDHLHAGVEGYLV